MTLRSALSAFVLLLLAAPALPGCSAGTTCERWDLLLEDDGRVGEATVCCVPGRASRACTWTTRVGVEDGGRLAEQVVRFGYTEAPDGALLAWDGPTPHVIGEAMAAAPAAVRTSFGAVAAAAGDARVLVPVAVVEPRSGAVERWRCYAGPVVEGEAVVACADRAAWHVAVVAMGHAGEAARPLRATVRAGVEARAATGSPGAALDPAAVATLGQRLRRGLVNNGASPSISRWRSAVRIVGEGARSLALEAPGRQSVSWEGAQAAVVRVVREPVVLPACATTATLERVGGGVRARPAARNPDPDGAGRFADCTEDATHAVSLLVAAGCDARAVVGVDTAGDDLAWHAWVEVVDGSGVYTLDPRSGEHPARASLVRLGQLESDLRDLDAAIGRIVVEVLPEETGRDASMPGGGT